MNFSVTAMNNLTAVSLKKTVIGVLGSKGGVGATTVAINLAAALSLESKQTHNRPFVLLDANLQQPDIALLLGTQPEHTLVDLMRTDAIEQKVFDACSAVVPGTNGLRIVSAPLDGTAASTTNLSRLAACLPGISAYANGLVIDLPKNLDRHLVTTVDACDIILLVIEANVASIAAAKRWSGFFDQLGYPSEKLCLVANRCGGKLQFIEQQLFKSFDGSTIFSLPNAFSLIETSAIEGVPMVVKHPKEKYSKSMKLLAGQLQRKSETISQSAPVEG
jgi:pilus assembly protein CpaE